MPWVARPNPNQPGPGSRATRHPRGQWHRSSETPPLYLRCAALASARLPRSPSFLQHAAVSIQTQARSSRRRLRRCWLLLLCLAHTSQERTAPARSDGTSQETAGRYCRVRLGDPWIRRDWPPTATPWTTAVRVRLGLLLSCRFRLCRIPRLTMTISNIVKSRLTRGDNLICTAFSFFADYNRSKEMMTMP